MISTMDHGPLILTSVHYYSEADNNKAAVSDNKEWIFSLWILWTLAKF